MIPIYRDNNAGNEETTSLGLQPYNDDMIPTFLWTTIPLLGTKWGPFNGLFGMINK